MSYEYHMKQYISEKTQKKFYGHDRLYSKHLSKIPQSAEREYTRTANLSMKLLKEVLESELPTIKQAYMEEMHRADQQGIHFDSENSLIATVKRTFARMKEQIAEKQKSFGIRKILEGIASLTSKLSVKEWKKVIKSTLGVDILEEYYYGDFSQNILADWITENVDLIVTIPKESLDKMEEIVLEGFKNGTATTTMMKQIQVEYSASKKHSKLLARDQIAKLNAKITQKQQQDAGIEEYIWTIVGDSRTRDDHRDLDGKIFKWNDPPIVDKKSGRRAHPGADFNCRCVARPVFKRDNTTLPIRE